MVLLCAKFVFLTPMTFVHPLLLWALAAVAIPVIIHLFNFRKYKKVYFTNVKFLRELQEESKSKSRLKELLILLTRCLAITCLVLAFSQPILINQGASTNAAGANALSLYIDNSFSTQNVNKQGPVFDIARQRAKEVVRAYNSNDRIQIITNDFEGRHQRFLTREDALSAIDELKISSANKLLSEVLKRQSEFIKASPAPNKKIFVFSDAQKSTFNIKDLKPDTAIITNLVPVKANQVNNVYVDSCWFDTPIQQKGFIQVLHARIINNGNARLDIASAKLFLNKQQVALASFSIEAASKAEVKFTFECKLEGLNYGSIKIEDYPVTFDDELYFAFNSRVNVSVCLINGKDVPVANAFTSLFGGDSLFKLTAFSEQTIDYALFKSSDVLVLNQLSSLSSGLIAELIKYTQQGGAVLFIPSQKADVNSYNSALGALKLPLLGVADTTHLKTSNINMSSGFYAGVFEKIEDRINLPKVNWHYRLVKTNSTDFESILLLQNGEDYFGFGKLNNASLYLFASALDESAGNFSKHALFVPTLYRVCFSALKQAPLFYPVSNNVLINLKNSNSAADEPPHIIELSSGLDIIPEVRTLNNSLYLYTRNQVSRPGFYNISRNKQNLLPLAFNHSRLESDLNCYSAEELAAVIRDKTWKNVRLIEDSEADISKQILQADGGKKLWKLFILLTLGFMLLEMTLLRLLK